MSRMPREELMGVLRACACMMGTFPWGEGVTTFEAFSRGLPVVVLPTRITVEQLTLGQIRELRLEEELVAVTIDEYVNKVVRFGKSKEWRRRVGGLILERGERLFGERQKLEVISEYQSFFQRAVSAL